jgi:NAD(P)-dependent dehydrogenase (short-subunit alcohol dehydrogenase family)
MERALVIGASGGIGQALVLALRGKGSQVVGLSRSNDGLDVTDEASIVRILASVEGQFDTVIVATGALEIGAFKPEKSLRALDPSALSAQFALNAIGPALVLKHSLRLLPKDRPARFAALSARVASIGDNALGGWYSYRAAKAALNQLIHSAAIEVARSHPLTTVALLHPGTVATGFGATYIGAHPTVTPDAAAANVLAVLGGLNPSDTGGFFDWAGKRIAW